MVGGMRVGGAMIASGTAFMSFLANKNIVIGG